MMATVIRMPEVATGTGVAAIQSWLVGVGDDVAQGQPIAEIETEKAVVEYESDHAGVVAALLVTEGDATAVGSAIAVLGAPGESVEDALAAAGVDAAATATDAPPAASAAPEPPAAAPGPAAPAAPEPAAPAAPAPTAHAAPAPAAPAPTAHADESGGDAHGSGSRLFATPLVRRLARERDIDLTAVTGTGPNGRIVRRDLERLAQGASDGTGPSASSADRAALRAAPGAAGYTDIPHTGMRRAIARRLTESTSTVPHFFLVAHCRVDELLALRRQINEIAPVKVSVNDLVVKAVAAALIEVPEANAIWTDEATRRFDTVDIAVAVSVEGGLLTPVVRGVEGMPLSVLSGAIRELADRARAGRLKQHELEGGSFSVSNLGMYGTSEFSAIINPPHAGILAVGAAQKRAVVAADGTLEAATMMTVTLSADHRVIDGAVGAQWLAAFQRRIENPAAILV